MLIDFNAARRATTRFALLLLLLACAAPPARGAQEGGERLRAFRLFAERKFDEAVPLLEKLAKESPNDGEVLGKLGVAVLLRSTASADAVERRRERVRARGLLTRAKALGVADDLVEVALNSITPDGGEPPGARFSDNAEADELMRAGEAAFARRDYDAALKAYEGALRLDPRLYQAPLFAGDVFLTQEKWDEAARWYARAVEMDPDRETAYRYWGNALMRQGRREEARDKYVGAVIADPYNGYVWRNGLFRWAEATRTRLGHPDIKPAAPATPAKDDKVTVEVNPQPPGKDGGGGETWLLYGVERASWAADGHHKFKKAYPTEGRYRHSLAEEAAALRAVAEAVKTRRREGEIKSLAPDLALLVGLHDEGLLEAFILFARADEGVAQDYAEYRKANRERLRRYLVEHVASGRY